MNAITQQCLNAHNEYRRKHGAPPMVISDSLMRMAQNWAQTNANQCNMYHSSNRGNVGENLYATSGSLSNGKDPVDSWYSEIKYYSFGRGGFSFQTGHFTQVVWKGSTQLGVGWAKGRNGWTYFCCNYATAGNYQGQFQSNVLPLGTLPPAPRPSPAPAAKPSPPAAKPSPPPAQASQPSSESCSSDEAPADDVVTKSIVRSSFKNAPPSEIVGAIFSGRYGNSMGHRMERGFHLSTNQYLMSQNRQFVAILQEDGNFVVYKHDKGGRADFATGTNNGKANQVQLRNDGHVTVIEQSNPQSPFWKSRRNTDGGDCFLVMQDDGNLVGYKGTKDTSPSNAYFSAWNLNL